MLRKLTIKDVEIKHKVTLVRVDFNVPLSADGKITDETRILATIPTIEYLLRHECKVILMSHLGKPQGKVKKELSLRIVAQRLAEILKKDVQFIENCFEPGLKEKIAAAPWSSLFLLENLRFYPEEEANDENFARYLASLGEVYVNDAFATAHRAHASTWGVAKYCKYSVAGLLMEKEIGYLSYLLFQPKKPYVAIIGGAKIKDKLGVIKNLLPKVDFLLLGGGLVFNFYKAQGFEIGKSIYEPEMVEEARKLIDARSSKLILPQDILIADKLLAEECEVRNTLANQILPEWYGVSLGEKTTEEYSRIIESSQTIVWAGPVGIFEIKKFRAAQEKLASSVVRATEKGATSVIGGGDTVAAFSLLGLKEKVSFVSTGGTATLEFLEGKELPGVSALLDKQG
jgi:phosphoglycerate kinase